MNHVLLIDPIEKLNIKKDSSLYMALKLKLLGKSVFLLFKEDLDLQNNNSIELKLYNFTGDFKEDQYYIDRFELTDHVNKKIDTNFIFHMRLDPPYNEEYQIILWKLKFLSELTNCKILNSPVGIMSNNEKLSAFALKKNVDSFITSNKEALFTKIMEFKNNKIESFILKPLNSFSGIGVYKHTFIKDDEIKDKEKIYNLINNLDYEHIILQPFLKNVEEGEFRVSYFHKTLLGAIIKKPKQGEFLSNIAQGAAFFQTQISKDLEEELLLIMDTLIKQGVYFVAFDVLGDVVTEINVTCPGLLVEVDFANKTNSVSKMLSIIESL